MVTLSSPHLMWRLKILDSRALSLTAPSLMFFVVENIVCVRIGESQRRQLQVMIIVVFPVRH